VLDAFRDDNGEPRRGADQQENPDLDQLTPREQEVLRLLARGYSYREIGSELFISIKTVDTHASNVLRKLQLSSRHQLTRWATDRRLV
jgi:DNA-binding NarL/FixJ family response regulator